MHSWIVREEDRRTFEGGAHILHKLRNMAFFNLHDMKGMELDWTLPGVSERGLYPIVPRSRAWYLDNGIAQPVYQTSQGDSYL